MLRPTRQCLRLACCGDYGSVNAVLATQDPLMKKWQCIVCGFIYDEAEGWPDDGIAPGTAWEDVPADWQCPDCGVGKEDFEMISIG